jgi:diguanylate cyclase (GGDEF)-like protein
MSPSSALLVGQGNANAASQTAGRLLIVDDLADNRALLTRRFLRRGYQIVEAAGGAEALSAIETDDFDCVLLDWMMPEMSGDEVLRRIRETRDAATLPVIMVTARDQSEDVVAALKFGANDYITKPVDFGVALARVENQVSRRRDEEQTRTINKSLQVAKQDLEERVAERTQKLRQADAVIQREVALRIASEDRISYLAHHDSLTGLPNRHTFDEQLNVMRQHARDAGCQLSLLFIDLDGFKNVNDTLGHEAGDELLRQIAQCLNANLQHGDFCARFGGDEFAVIHMAADAHRSAQTLAETIIAAISAGQTIAGHQVYVGASVGISLFSGGDNDVSALLKQADLAMYRAKAEGRGFYRIFEPEMSLKAESRRQLEVDLREAIKRGEFQLYYQPVVDMKSRMVVGFEALLRWKHPVRGFVPPADFISLAEETGLIVPIGEWVIRQACTDAAIWPNEMRVAINLSPIQFRSTGLVPIVISALANAGLSAGRLDLEITENVMLGDSRHNIAILEKLRELGVRISLDDFGTGFSGLGYFRAFQFDKVKIDQSFVREMMRHPESLAIVRAAIGLGANLGIQTTAEGVESFEQLERLAIEGCDEVQGFLFSAPQPNRLIPEIILQIERSTS